MSILLLHGYGQSGDLYLKKIKNILGAEFMSQFQVFSPNAPINLSDGKYGWFNIGIPHEKSPNRVVEVVNNSLNGADPLKPLYVISFSQGGSVAEMMILQNLFRIPPSKAILISPSGIPKTTFTSIPTIPILVYMGIRESLSGISKRDFTSNSLLYSELCEIEVHDQGHVIPSKSKYKTQMREFILA
jgi:predicted esterase